MKKFPGFELQNGREPISGVDYDPDATLCQDDYEYFAGIGRYTKDPNEVNGAEFAPYRGARIYYTGDQANIDGEGTITRVNTDSKFYPITYDVSLDDGRVFHQILPNSFQDAPGRRFWILSEWEARRQAQLEAFAARYGVTLQAPVPPLRPISRYALVLDEEEMCLECGADLRAGHYLTCSHHEE